MGTYNIIPQFSLHRYNYAERLHILERLRERLLAVKNNTEEEGGDGPSIQALSTTGSVDALGITEEQMAKLDELIAIFRSATYESTANAMTAELEQTDEDRCRVVNYMVRRILDYNRLPMKAEQEAGKLMSVGIKPYNKFGDEPVTQRTHIIDGFLEDVRNPEYAEAVETLGISTYITEAEQLNEKYKELEVKRDSAAKERRIAVSPTEKLEETQDLLDDIFMMANAHSLVNPSDEATDFINEMNNILAKARADRNKRGGKKEEDDEAQKPATDKPETPENPDSETPDTETPDTETPDTENPGSGEEELPDDRPTV